MQNEKPLLADLRGSIIEHHLPIMSLGSGRTSLQDKFCAIMFAMMLEAGAMPDSLASFAQEIVASTADLGVEFSLSRIVPTSFNNLCPWFSSSDAGASNLIGNHDDADGDGDADLFDVFPVQDGGDGNAETLSFQNMLSVPGPLHIIDNATKRLLDQMPYLRQAIPKLGLLSRFLSDHAYKQRLLSTCFHEQIGQAFRPSIERFHAKVNEGRWGSVAFAIPELLKLQVPLTRFWHFESFMFGQVQAQARDQQGQGEESAHVARLDLVNEAIESLEFWGQLATLDRLFQVVRDIFEWVESCPCHYKRDAPSEVKKAWQMCPLRGRRLAEISSGDLFQVVHELCLVNAAELFAELPAGLSEEGRAACLLDFEHGRGHLTFQLTLKLSCFLELPLLLLGAARHNPDNPDLQRHSVKRCVDSDSQHPLLQRLRQGSLKEEVDLYLDGEELLMLENLKEFLGSMLFAWGTERKVEGGHAQVKMLAGSRRNRTEATDSLALRLAEIRLVLTSSDITAFLECVQAARSPRKLVARLGLERHPSCRLARSNWDPIYRKIVYHADPLSLYDRNPPQLLASLSGPGSSARPLAQALQDADEDVAPEVQEVQRALALRHLKQELAVLANSKDKRVLFSCSMPSGALSLLSKWLVPSQSQDSRPQSTAGAVAAASSGADSGAVVPAQTLTDVMVSEVSCEERVFFRVVSAGLSKAKLASPVDFSSTELGILLLKAVQDADGFAVETSGFKIPPAFANSSSQSLQEVPLVCSLSCLTVAQLRSFRVWDESASIRADVESATTSVLARCPKEVLLLRSDLPIADRSNFQLLGQLLADGWQCWVARDASHMTGL